MNDQVGQATLAGIASARYGLLGLPLASYVTEVLQYFLPGRVPSLADWALNSAGAIRGTNTASK